MITDILKSAYHPSEVLAMVRIKLSNISISDNKDPLESIALQTNDRDFCYASLNKVSRSFAIVIQQLPENLKDPVLNASGALPEMPSVLLFQLLKVVGELLEIEL